MEVVMEAVGPWLEAAEALQAEVVRMVPAPIAESAAAVDALAVSTAAQIGFPADQFKYVVCLLIAYPLAWIHRWLPNVPALKHLYSIFFGLCFGFFCFGPGMIHSFITAILTYAVVATVKGSLAPRLVFLVTVGHLSISHILRMYYDYGGYELDYTGPQMVLVIKLTSFAYNVYDGTRMDKLHPELKARAIVRMPSLLEYFGYVYFFGSFLAGPGHEFVDYQRMSDLTLFDKEVGKNGHRRIPPTYWPATKSLLSGLACFVGIHFSGQYPISRLASSEFLASSTFWERYFYLQIACSLQRFQYYFIWLIAEGACIATGLGYNGRDASGHILWDRVNNVDVIGVEFAENFKSVTDMWNRKTNSWLRYYVYMRLTPDNGKPAFSVTMLTYLTSAFWHGFYAGYYMTFFSGALADGKTAKPTKVIYDVVGWFVTMNTLNYICTSFVLLSWQTSIEVYRSLYFCIHGITVALLLLSYVVPVKKSSGHSHNHPHHQHHKSAADKAAKAE